MSFGKFDYNNLLVHVYVPPPPGSADFSECRSKGPWKSFNTINALKATIGWIVLWPGEWKIDLQLTWDNDTLKIDVSRNNTTNSTPTTRSLSDIYEEILSNGGRASLKVGAGFNFNDICIYLLALSNEETRMIAEGIYRNQTGKQAYWSIV